MTGMMATQFGKKMGAKVIAVSKYITEYDRVAEKVKDLTKGKMADVVLNSLWVQTWENSFASAGLNGRWVTFGGLTGADVKLNVQSLYSKQIKLVGCNGGTRKEITEVIEMSKELKTRVWKIFTLDEAKEALEARSFLRKEMGGFFWTSVRLSSEAHTVYLLIYYAGAIYANKFGDTGQTRIFHY
jgi:NADPH:quinone reductase-like Zn-dependent oxidoreductase